MKVMATISNWIQPIAIRCESNPPPDVDWIYCDPVASVDSAAQGIASTFEMIGSKALKGVV